VLLDNIAVYALPENADRKDADLAFAQAAADGAVPFVPTSPAHRPNTVKVKTVTEHPGGLLIRSKDADQAAESLSLQISNLLGDARRAEVSYTMVDINEKQVGTGKGTAGLPPYGLAMLKVTLPPGLLFGPYELRYSLNLTSEENSVNATTRFGIMPARDTSVGERGRMDYPFSLWMPTFLHAIGTLEEETLGRLADSAGMGKTWFGCGGKFYPGHFLSIADPEARKKALADRIGEAKVSIAVWKKYGVTPMGAVQDAPLLEPSQYPVLEEVVGTIVGALKDDVKCWRYGTESVHGNARELDRATLEKGLSVQGGTDYLYWGRKGTVRQYWQEYFVAYAAAKKADPACIFGPQVASDIAGNVLRLFFEVGGKGQIDSFGMNTYISAFSIWPPNLRELEENGLPDLPLYISEFAAKSDAPLAGPGHLKKEKEASGSMVSYWASVLQQFPSLFHVEMWGMRLDDEVRSLTYQGLVRPQYLAYATMTNLLGAGKFVAQYNLSNAEIYTRQRSVREGFVSVAWAKNGIGTVDLEVGPGNVRICDLWGNSRDVVPVDGVVSVELTQDPIYVIASQEIKPARTVAILIGHATLEAASPRVRVLVTNDRKEPVSGTLELLADGPLQISDRKREIAGIAPGESAEFIFDVRPVGAPLDRRINIRARITSGAKVYDSSAALNFHTAARNSEPPAIDAKAEKWEPNELSQIVDRKDQVSIASPAKPWGGPQDLSVRAGFRWSEKDLHVIFQVRDDEDKPPQAEIGMWKWDVIELLVDVNRGLSGGSPFTMFSLSRFPDGPRLLRHDGALPTGKVPGARIAANKVGDTVTYEATIPWEEIQKGFAPKPGQVISIAWGVDDHDGGNTGRELLSWFTNVSGKNTAEFGDLILVETP